MIELPSPANLDSIRSLGGCFRRVLVTDTEDMEVQLSSERAIPADDILTLYASVDWWPDRTADQIEAAISRGQAVGAWQEERLIGFARSVTDGRLRAYIEDVVVHPQHREMGVGSALVGRLLEALSDIDLVSLFCDEDLVSWYERADFARTRQVVMHLQGRSPREPSRLTGPS
jgi:GNAT superfamily N-acetyltransferase